MLIAANQIYGCSLEAADGAVGKIKDLLFDGRSWKVRYLDVDTGGWLPGRRVILSPEVIRSPDYSGQRLATPLTKQEVEDSPPLHSDLPVSRQNELDLARYYAWGAYLSHMESAALGKEPQSESQSDPNLRSTHAVSGYRIQAIDGEIGHVDDFIIDDESYEGGPWEIRYLVIDTRNWLPGKAVLIPPLWAESIDWDTQRVEVGLTQGMIERSPEYDPATPVNRRYEQVFYDYYGRPTYWAEASRSV